MDEIADTKQLRKRVIRWTAAMWTLIALVGISLGIYIEAVKHGEAALPPHVNVIIYIFAATAVVLSFQCRHQATDALCRAQTDKREVDRETSRDARLSAMETTLVQVVTALAGLVAAVAEHEKNDNHRAGRMYQGAFRATKELVRVKRQLDRLDSPTLQLPRPSLYVARGAAAVQDPDQLDDYMEGLVDGLARQPGRVIKLPTPPPAS